MRLNPYLSFNGNCEAAFRFYEEVLGGKMVALITPAETPIADQFPPDWQQKIVHARLALGDFVLMGADCTPDRYAPMTGFAVTLNIDDPAEAERIFNALAEGGTVTMPIEETFWAVRFGMLTDRFGTPWMINCETPM
jgi:PhnB protein